MAYLYFAIIVACGLGNNIFKNIFAKGKTVTDGDNAIYNAIACGIGAPLALVGSGFSAISAPSLLVSVLFGASMAGVAISAIKALRLGPVTITVLFSDFSIVLPILSGFLIWKEPLTAAKVAGTLIMFCSIYFLVNKTKGKKEEKAQRSWALWAVLFGLTCGLMAFFQQIQTKSGRGESTMFLFWGFSTATVILIIYLIICNRKPSTAQTVNLFGKENLNGLLVGIFGGISHLCTMQILTMMDSTVYYPLKSGVSIAANTLCGFLLFKEKLCRRQVIGLVLGFIAIMLLTLAR